MKKVCTTQNPEAGMPANGPIEVTLDEYEPKIGAPFKVLLIKSVRQTLSPAGDVLDTCIPNTGGLLKEIALARSLCERKFSAAEIKFVRKAVGLKANELAELLGVSAEHLSRCENGDRALSIAAEKLFRVIVLKRRYNYSSIRDRLISYLEDDELNETKRVELREFLAHYNECVADLERAIFDSKIESVHDVTHELAFQFELKYHEPALDNAKHSQDEDEWKRAA